MKERRNIPNIFHRFKNCWPAIRKGVHGVILVYSAKIQDSSRQLKEFYDYFINGTKLGPNNCVIFVFNPDNTASSASKIICKYINNIYKKIDKHIIINQEFFKCYKYIE